MSKELAGPKKFGFVSLLCLYLAKIERTKKFNNQSVIFDGFWRFFEVHSILNSINSTDLIVEYFFGLSETLGTHVDVQISHG